MLFFPQNKKEIISINSAAGAFFGASVAAVLKLLHVTKSVEV